MTFPLRRTQTRLSGKFWTEVFQYSFCNSFCTLELLHVPNQQRTLNELPTELRCQKFVNKHRLSSKKIGAKCVKTCMQCVYTVFQLSLHFAYHRWWLGKWDYPTSTQEGKGETLSTCAIAWLSLSGFSLWDQSSMQGGRRPLTHHDILFIFL